jgi:hypothetical protein
MFVRFRQTERRLQVSLVESRRAGGKVRHDHIASFGSVEVPPSVRSRVKFWLRLSERLAHLGNRIDAAMQEKILGDIHARIPMVTLGEQRDLKTENAKADERFWSLLKDLHESTASDHEGMATAAQSAAADGRAVAADAKTKAAEAAERIARIERGEDIAGGLSEPINIERFLRAAGWRTRDLDNARMLSDVSQAYGNEIVMREIVDKSVAASNRAKRAVVRRLARKLGR